MQPPTAPTSLTAANSSASQIALSWTAATDNVAVTGYNVYRASGSGIYTLAGTSTATSFTDSGLTAGTSYNYLVQAYDAAGNVSPGSNVASAAPQVSDTTPPTTPTNLTASAASASQINLAWNASTDNVGVAGYQVYRSTIGSAFAQVATVGGTATSYADGSLASETTYTYYVVAFDAAGNVSSPSAKATATTLTPTANVTGTVTSGGAPVSGATVSLVANGKTMTTTTNSSGGYALSGVPAATCSLTYSARHYSTKTISATLAAASTTTENVALTKSH